MPKRELDEIEVDLTQPTPLSKKQKRLVKKGKAEPPKPSLPQSATPPARSPHAVWIGNLSFDTSGNQLREFIIEKTASFKNPVTGDDITRVKLPSRKGFAYVDVRTAEQKQSVISISESRLDGRNLLIKDASSFEGRPAKVESRTPPSRVLFVGNLSFDTIDSQLEQHFQHCGEIQRIRMATFEDSGKCKGFAFIDFIDEEAATKALADRSCRKLNGRDLRMEYGEDRSKRRPKIAESGSDASVPSEPAQSNGEATREVPRERSNEHPKPRSQPRENKGRSRPTPGAALMNANRAKHAVVASQGKKVTFD